MQVPGCSAEHYGLRSRHPASSRRKQRRGREGGQALVFGVFVLFAGLAALFFFFNTGQLSQEKTKLVNTADAAAYSAGVMHARAMNFAAYTNRAMVANTVAIAQLVSLSSWAQYVEATSMSPQAYSIGNPTRYAPFFPSYLVILTQGQYLDSTLVETGVLENHAAVSDRLIQDVLMNAQHAAHAVLPGAREEVMQDVVKSNYINDGDVTAEALPSSQAAYSRFVRRYSGNDRGRFAEVAVTAAKRDGFQERRSWYLRALYPQCFNAMLFGRSDWMDRRGGTELIGFDEWKAVDTLSEKRWHPRNKWDIFCRGLAEHPAGWGAQAAADNSSLSIDPRHFDHSPVVNPGSTGIAVAFSSDDWGYSGIPSFYDLTPNALSSDDPRLRFGVRLRRSIDQTATSEGRSAIRQSARLNSYQAEAADGELVAVSVSEVFFERPDVSHSCGGARMGRANCYGRAELGKGREIGSLFNPYWNVRLVQDDAAVAEARAMQGAH